MKLYKEKHINGGLKLLCNLCVLHFPILPLLTAGTFTATSGRCLSGVSDTFFAGTFMKTNTLFQRLCDKRLNDFEAFQLLFFVC